jgi:hypothetical protein
MQHLMQTLEKSVQTAVEQYVKRIVEKYDNTDEDTLLALWSEETKVKASKPKPQKAPKEKTPDDTTSRKSSGMGCPYQFSKGEKSGTVCGVKPKSGATYCATHKKFEGQEPKEKKVVPEPKKVAKSPPSKDTKPVFHKHKTLDVLVHKDTGMVIKSSSETNVIGKLVGNKVEKLSKEDLEICANWRFKVEGNVPKTKPSESDEDADSEQEETPKTKSAAKTASKPTPNPASKLNSESEEDDEDKPAVKATKVAPKAVTKPAAKQSTAVAKPAPVKKLVESDDENEDSDEEPPKKTTTKQTPKTVTKGGKKSSDTDDLVADLDEVADTKMVVKAFGAEDELSDSEQD